MSLLSAVGRIFNHKRAQFSLRFLFALFAIMALVLGVVRSHTSFYRKNMQAALLLENKHIKCGMADAPVWKLENWLCGKNLEMVSAVQFNSESCIDQECLGAMAELTDLVSVWFIDVRDCDEVLLVLGSFDRLGDAAFENSPFSGNLLGRLSHLKCLVLSEACIDEETAKSICRLPALEIVNLSSCSFQPSAVSSLQLPDLPYLELKKCALSDQLIRQFETYRSLWAIAIIDAQLGGHDLSRILQMTKLKVADFSGSEMSAESIAGSLAESSIVCLSLSRAKIGSECLAKFTAMPKLFSLDLSESNVTNEGLRELAKATQLTLLNLNNTQVDEESLALLLNSCPKLEGVRVLRTSIAADAIQRLRLQHPDIEIEY